MFGLFTGLLGVVLSITPLGEDLETNLGLTWMFKTRGPLPSPPQVSVVAINERASAAIGLPTLPRDWPRSIHAQLIDNLVKRGAAVIVFDVDFRRPKTPADDLVFTRSVAAANRVVLVETLTGKRQPVMDRQGRQTGSIWMEQLLPPMPELVKASKGLAPFPVPKIQTNVFEFWAFKPSANDAGTLPSVALQLFSMPVYEQWIDIFNQAGGNRMPRAADIHSAEDLRNAMRVMRQALHDNPALRGNVETLIAAKRATMPDGTYPLFKALAGMYSGASHRFLNFYGPPGTIVTVPYNAVITGSDPNVDPRNLDFRGKVVFVGFSDLLDPGQPDRFYTVFTDDHGVDLSGVELAATAFANLLTDRSITPVDTFTLISIMFLFGFLLGAGVYVLPAIFAVPLSFALTGAYAYGALWLFTAQDYWLPLATPILVQFPVALFVGLLAQYLLERRQHRRMSKAVGVYLPEHIAKELAESELDPSSLNKVVYGVCLANDMSGFSTLAQLMSPKELADFMNAYFEALAGALKKNHVEVTEFHADTVMCAWIANQGKTLARQNALLAALDVVETVNQFNANRPGSTLYARVGLDEGEFYLGHTGGGGRMGYSILGDPANTAARLETLNKVLRTHVLASDIVVGDATDLLLRPLGRFQLVGRTTATGTVEIVARASQATEQQRDACERFAQALAAFNQYDWAKAGELFDAVLENHPQDGPAQFYRDRCRAYAAQAPQMDEPSIIVMTSKE